MSIYDEGENPYTFGDNFENPSGENPVFFGYDPRIEYGENPSVIIPNTPQSQPTSFWETELLRRTVLPETEEYADLLDKNPNEYYKRYALALSNKIALNFNLNNSDYNQFLLPEFESLKEKNPAAYLQGKINLLSRQAGWQYGQNTSSRAKPFEDEIKNLVTESDKLGLNYNDLNSIINSGFSEASLRNQQRIANEAASGGSGFNLGEILRGSIPVAALAIGGPLFSALSAPAAAGVAGGTATGTGLTGGVGGATGLLGGGSVGAGLSAGSAAGIAGTQAAAGLGIAGGSALAGTGAAIGAGLGGVGGLSPALPAAGGVGGAGAMSAQLAPGTILGTGLPGGGAIGSSYMLGAGGLPALNSAGQLIPASSISFGGQAVPTTNLGIKEALDVARLGKNLLGQSTEAPTGATQQFKGSKIPQGSVDYSGILNLLQARSPQRNPYSLLG